MLRMTVSGGLGIHAVLPHRRREEEHGPVLPLFAKLVSNDLRRATHANRARGERED